MRPTDRYGPRKFADALITDPEEAAEQAVRLVHEGRAQTLCVHGDHLYALRTLATVAKARRDQATRFESKLVGQPPSRCSRRSGSAQADVE